MFKLMKVFDCQEMPGKIRMRLLDCSTGVNGNYVGFTVGKTDTYGEREGTVSQWLLENGAEDGEYVLIKRWW